MKENVRRGIPIGAYTSQPLGNFIASPIAHYMKDVMRSKCFLMYCDDALCLARSKGEAWTMLNEFEAQAERLGLVVKASAVVAPIAHLANEKKHRKRQRGGRKKNRLSRLSIQSGGGTSEEVR